MESVLELLEEKNVSLEKFYRLNEAELENISSGDFNHLESFYCNREGILEIIKKIDKMIEESNEAFSDDGVVTTEMKTFIRRTLHYKNELVNKILEQDLKILSLIEETKSKMIKELTQVRATKKALGSYKSGKASSKLDEEA